MVMVITIHMSTYQRDLERLGKMIQKRRLQRKMSMLDLSVLANTTQSTISTIEQGYASRMETYVKILDALELNLTIVGK